MLNTLGFARDFNCMAHAIPAKFDPTRVNLFCYVDEHKAQCTGRRESEATLARARTASGKIVDRVNRPI